MFFLLKVHSFVLLLSLYRNSIKKTIMKISKLLIVSLFLASMLFIGSFGSVYSQYEVLRGKKILFTYGGWAGHEPEQCKDVFVPWLESVGAEVIVSDNLGVYKDSVLMNSVDLIIQTWTMGSTQTTVGRDGQPQPPDLDPMSSRGLLGAVRRGVGFAGWHGGIGDAFRNDPEFQYMVGGQWVAHPGNVFTYTVNITDKDNPVTRGLAPSFQITSEQYYLHVDPNIKVLATTKYNGNVNAWIDGAIIPVVWEKTYGKGRVFYSSLGHVAKDFDNPEVFEIMKRGICWAVQSLHEPNERWVSPVYPN
jgi:type 1 glutamine amidotransferase